jgi:glycosyltransferase involved in cell wall biosynthesis
MANALVQRGHTVQVATYHLGDPSPTPLYQLHRTRSVPSYRKVSPGPSVQKLVVLDPLLTARLRRLLREERFDVIHAHHFEGLLVALAARRDDSIPIVFDIHTLLESELPYYGIGPFRGLLQRIGRLLDRRLPARADHLIAVSELIRDKLLDARTCSAERISIVESGVTWEHFQRSNGIAPDTQSPVLIYTGNLAAYQGVDLMLRAFATVVRGHPAVRLRIVTDSPFTPYDPLAQALGVRGRLEIHSATFEEIPDCLAGAYAALNPRVHCDGAPQKLINYMAAGKAIVSFAGSARGLIDGRNGLVVPDGDVDAFAGAIQRLLIDPGLAVRLGRSAGQSVRGGTWEAAAEKVEAVYRRILPGPPR